MINILASFPDIQPCLVMLDKSKHLNRIFHEYRVDNIATIGYYWKK
ncbi:MAG: hypothetical protein P9L92_18130 [Candidatus Electryonea clarkiae]|nr:hypothetical protein [Candidatus Electryonea clarkiae]MDP8288183.1 hypothetical protein [Candidatus Electryonea clarkiae]